MTDERLLKEIYERYARELISYIYGFVRVRETAEDILHDAFVKLIKYSRDYSLDERNIRAFLYKTARNLCIDDSRKNRKKQESRLEENIEYAGARDDQESVEYKELRQYVDRLVDEKDPVSRSVYIMRTELSLPYEEIAKNLGISERTVKRKMRAMIEYLADSLEKSGFKLLFLFFMALILIKIVI